MSRKTVAVMLLLFGLGYPARALAQSSIAGVVRDTTGGALPGVTVEAASPALIERVRSVTTDEAGQYKIINLRPGTYTVTFTLTGFSAVKREGIDLPPNFTASVNGEMRVGAVEETITVSGAASLVDVQSATRAQVLNAELLNALPTARNFQTAALALPGLKAGGFDVGGSTQQQQGVVVSAGGLGLDQIMMVDGMNVMSWTGGKGTVVYHNVGGYQEMAYQSFGAPSEVQSGGVIMNMVPKTGGNDVHFEGVGLYANGSMEGHNQTPELLARGFRVPSKLARNYDVNGSLGFPVRKDRLWWFSSVRYWTYDRYVANQFNPDGSQAIDDNITKAYTNRMTWQATPRNKLSALYDKLPRSRYHSGIENGNVSPEATSFVDYDLGYIGQAKYTGTLSNRLLVEAGWSSSYYRATSRLQSLDQYPSASKPYGAISHNDSTLNQTTVAPATYSHPLHLAIPHTSVSVAYVTGSHAVRTGVQYAYGIHRTATSSNGDIQQLYRAGVPFAVNVYNTPTQARTKINYDFALYAQDSWTLNRLTLTPGIRYEAIAEGFPEQDTPAGRFVGARHFDKLDCVPCWKDVLYRFGAAYDLFGDSKTAIKGSVGKYTNTETYDTADLYNPMNVVTDQRTWTDPNRDDIAQDNEIGPSTNANFGKQTRFPAADLKRPYQILYSLGGQRELTQGVSGTFTFYHRSYRRIITTENTPVPRSAFDTAFSKVVIPDPRNNGQSLTVYNLNPLFLGRVNRVDDNSDDSFRTYDGFDVTVQARLPARINLVGGTSTGKFHRRVCDVEDPNSLRFCDATQPFRTTFKLSGSVPLKYGVRFSGVFQSSPGQTFERDASTDGDIVQTYVVTRAVVPTLTNASVSVRLNEPGTDFMPRVNQLDLSFSKRVQVGRASVSPQFEIFNTLNASPELSITQTFGAAYGRPLTVLPARLFRVGLQVSF